MFEAGVKMSKENKAIRRIAEPINGKALETNVTNLHRIYKVATYPIQEVKD